MKRLIAITTIALAGVGIAPVKADHAALWAKNCASCHGKDGKGDTKMGKKLDAKDYTDPKVQDAMTDEQAFKAIKEGVVENGKERMKAYNDKLSDEEIKGLVAYMRTFKK